LLNGQVGWVWVRQLSLIPGLKEQVSGEEVDEQVAWEWAG
jgi:hypothetical protein